MALTSFGFLVTGAQLHPARDRVTLSSPVFEMTVIGMSSPADGPAAAAELVAGGVQLIELCGGFGPVHTAAVIAAIDGQVPVGAVGYGPEAIDALHQIFS